MALIGLVIMRRQDLCAECGMRLTVPVKTCLLLNSQWGGVDLLFQPERCCQSYSEAIVKSQEL